MESSGRNHYQTRGSTRGGASATADRDLLLQWGNRKRVRCTKTQQQQHREDSTSSAAAAAFAKPPATPAPAPNQRVLRRASPNSATRSLRNNTEDTRSSSTMRGTTASHHHHQHHQGSNGSGNGAGTEDRKGSSSGSEGNIWPKFAISLTNKEKEEDFLVFKGSKLPQRPKKRAKLLQRTINLVSPGLWLCDLTLERYEVREKKVSKKRPRGLRAMHNMDSDSE